MCDSGYLRGGAISFVVQLAEDARPVRGAFELVG